MRFLLIAVIWIVCIGGLWLYTGRRDAVTDPAPPPATQFAALEHAYAVEVTPTFTAEADPFALNADSKTAAAIEIRLNGAAVELASAPLSRGQTLALQPLKNLLAGANELFIKASPPTTESHLDHGVRVRILEDGVPILDRTLWGNQGALVSGTIMFTVSGKEKTAHDH